MNCSLLHVDFLRALLGILDSCPRYPPNCDTIASVLKASLAAPPLPYEDIEARQTADHPAQAQDDLESLKSVIMGHIKLLRCLDTHSDGEDFSDSDPVTVNNLQAYAVFEAGLAHARSQELFSSGEPCSWDDLEYILDVGLAYE